MLQELLPLNLKEKENFSVLTELPSTTLSNKLQLRKENISQISSPKFKFWLRLILMKKSNFAILLKRNNTKLEAISSSKVIKETVSTSLPKENLSLKKNKHPPQSPRKFLSTMMEITLAKSL
jgi:hypothetical protein